MTRSRKKKYRRKKSRTIGQQVIGTSISVFVVLGVLGFIVLREVGEVMIDDIRASGETPTEIPEFSMYSDHRPDLQGIFNELNEDKGRHRRKREPANSEQSVEEMIEELNSIYDQGRSR